MGLRPTQDDEEQWWRELQLAASASAGERVPNFGMFFNGVVLPSPFCRGTPVSRRPPYRSVGAGLLHTAPTSDEWRRSARSGGSPEPERCSNYPYCLALRDK
jgi:hypothetical protein